MKMARQTNKKVQGNDAFQRMNYLYQLSKVVVEKNPSMASYFGNLMINIGKKNVLRIHPEIKRQICRKCKCILISNVSATMKIKGKKKLKTIQWSCRTCGYTRTIRADKDKDHRVWSEKEESVIEVIS